MRKLDRQKAIRARAARAIAALYHNATPTYPAGLDDLTSRRFDAWFADYAADSIAHLNDGGAYGRDYAATLAAPCNAGRYASEAARRYYVAKGLRAMRMDRATTQGGLAERITQYGRLYTYGRGGRTLAPDRLIRTFGGSSFCPDERHADGLPLADVVDLIRTVEAFNASVRAWNEGLPDDFRDMTEADTHEASAILEFND
jgi:hypothetical protein